MRLSRELLFNTFDMGEITPEIVIADFKKYRIRNIRKDYDNEFIWFLAESLVFDYNNKKINYRAYIKRGMDIRVLMSLRNTFWINTCEESDYLYDLLSEAKTEADVKRIRTDFVKKFNSDYRDEEWQLMYLIMFLNGKLGKDVYINFEDCYADGNPALVKDMDEYKNDFLQAHFGELLERAETEDVIC